MVYLKQIKLINPDIHTNAESKIEHGRRQPPWHFRFYWTNGWADDYPWRIRKRQGPYVSGGVRTVEGSYSYIFGVGQCRTLLLYADKMCIRDSFGSFVILQISFIHHIVNETCGILHACCIGCGIRTVQSQMEVEVREVFFQLAVEFTGREPELAELQRVLGEDYKITER